MEPLMTLYQQPGSSKLSILHNDGIKAYPHKFCKISGKSAGIKIQREALYIVSKFFRDCTRLVFLRKKKTQYTTVLPFLDIFQLKMLVFGSVYLRKTLEQKYLLGKKNTSKKSGFILT